MRWFAKVLIGFLLVLGAFYLGVRMGDKAARLAADVTELPQQ